jgi:cytochrome c-type biogenesis protein CcmH
MRWRDGLIFLLALAGPAAGQKLTVKEVGEELVCQCGCNHVLYNCTMQNCHSATPMREEIQNKLDEGQTKKQIVAAFVEQYGMKVLSAPPPRGFNLSAWVIPFVALGAGAFVAVKVLQSWRRRTVAAAPTVAAFPQGLSDERRLAIERELEDFDR